MKLDQAKVRAAMVAAGKDHGQVASYLRRHGLPATTAQWLRMAAAGRAEVRPEWVAVWAEALGVFPGALLAPEDAATAAQALAESQAKTVAGILAARGRVLAAKGHLTLLPGGRS
jgi:hypothetical protein